VRVAIGSDALGDADRGTTFVAWPAPLGGISAGGDADDFDVISAAQHACNGVAAPASTPAARFRGVALTSGLADGDGGSGVSFRFEVGVLACPASAQSQARALVVIALVAGDSAAARVAFARFAARLERDTLRTGRSWRRRMQARAPAAAERAGAEEA
jgi:hypothetical protein